MGVEKGVEVGVGVSTYLSPLCSAHTGRRGDEDGLISNPSAVHVKNESRGPLSVKSISAPIYGPVLPPAYPPVITGANTGGNTGAYTGGGEIYLDLEGLWWFAGAVQHFATLRE